MAQQFIAAPSNKGYVPAFVVEKLEGEYEAVVARRDTGTRGIETEKVMMPRGYLVTMARGHSIHVADMNEMRRLGFDKTIVPIVDEDGEVVGSIPNNVRTRKVKTDA